MTKTIHEPEEALMNTQDVWEDFLRLKELDLGQNCMTVAIDAETDNLIHEIVDKGICADAAEVVVRAVRGFFAATWPSTPDKMGK